jgi:uncharacterized LabA/DUF88 family protein
MKSVVYVDGFNLYYGAVKGTPYKWLDIASLCQALLPKSQIVQIKYFTALVKSRLHDPNQPKRQQIYLRALRTIPNFEIILGRFLSHERDMPLAGCSPGQQHYARVIKTEEKGSDVNLAVHLLNDGYQGRYETAVVVSNDSDLAEAIRIVRYVLNKPVIVLNPFPKSASFELRKTATFVKPIRKGVLGASQFPHTIKDSKGTFFKPKEW